MPFWWRRRRKPWFGRFRYRKRRYNPRRRRKRFYQRRRHRRTAGRRRKRKVRRKKLQKITIKQWQPESIHKCKIVGFSNLVLGAEGTQYLCWTNEQGEYTQPKAPGGGGFGSELITLEWLYKQWRAHNNIWTKSNKNKDLVRYTGGKIKLFRHPTTDFVFSYSLSAPFELTKFTYADLQPQNMLLRPKKKVILSLLSKPYGKKTVTVKLKPPKQMSTKWFFQNDFAEAGLVLLQATAANFRYPSIAPKAQNQIITLYYLDTGIFNIPNWAHASSTAWVPQGTYTTYKFTTKSKSGADITTTMPPTTLKSDKYKSLYLQSISRDDGWWQKAVLNAYKVERNNELYANRVVYAARYNPNEDTGEGNEVWVVSLQGSKWSPPLTNPELIISGQPLWMAFHGYYSFLKYTLKDKAFDTYYMFVVKCTAIHPITVAKQSFYPFIDWDFINGVLPWEENISTEIAATWYPQARFQTTTINAFVESGPFIPRYSNIAESTWELGYKYKFFFKWGGPQAPDEPVDDPKGKHSWDVPDTLHETIQIGDPKKQTAQSILHQWDYRRGIITQTALKRMSENIQTDTDFQSDESESPKKKRKVTKEMPYKKEKEEKLHQCLLSLCEENTFQEPPENFQQLINQQQQQQSQLKRNILKLLTHLKRQQRFLGLQTGVLD
nr:MAG: ORF1 [Torque teno midi virus]